MAAIFITKQVIQTEVGDYGGIFQDRVAKNTLTQDLYIDVRGQWEGRRDYIVDNAIKNNEDIHIFTRNKANDTFIYQGIAQILEKDERKIEIGVKGENILDLAYFHFVIKSTDVVNHEIPRNPIYTGCGCLKKACLNYIGHSNPNKAAISQCFVDIY